MSVAFDFSASLIDVAPVSPMIFSVDIITIKTCLLMNAICVLSLLCSPLRLSFASVLFDFNASLNDVAPVSPISFSVDANKRKIHETVFEKTVHSMI